jgi:trk system potassium uptake protein TrkH
MDFRPIFLVIGILLATLALVMLVPAAVDAFTGHPDWEVFAISSGVTLFVGVAMALTSRAGAMHLTIRQAFAMTTLSWLAMTFFASLPFVYSSLGLNFTDAFFEAMSGITTTGSTVITDLDKAPRGILLWRALLQWLGGIGIIVMAIAVLPAACSYSAWKVPINRKKHCPAPPRSRPPSASSICCFPAFAPAPIGWPACPASKPSPTP